MGNREDVVRRRGEKEVLIGTSSKRGHKNRARSQIYVRSASHLLRMSHIRILSADIPLSPDVSHLEFCSTDIPPSPDVSHPEFCPADVPPSPDISHPTPDVGWERRAIQLPRSDMSGSSDSAYSESIRSQQFRFPKQLGSSDTCDSPDPFPPTIFCSS
uniref:Uncharacterized protein n=1 Tax=Vitis vinifera TaxID=29760 RepID=A5BY22_VITVI|nr:hypothetical protein VITISV_031493 [Vitis vinifera]